MACFPPAVSVVLTIASSAVFNTPAGPGLPSPPDPPGQASDVTERTPRTMIEGHGFGASRLSRTLAASDLALEVRITTGD